MDGISVAILWPGKRAIGSSMTQVEQDLHVAHVALNWLAIAVAAYPSIAPKIAQVLRERVIDSPPGNDHYEAGVLALDKLNWAVSVTPPLE